MTSAGSSKAEAAICRGCAFPATTPATRSYSTCTSPNKPRALRWISRSCSQCWPTSQRPWTTEVLAAADPERLQAMGIGYEQLQLVPTGRAELELTTLNLDLSVNGDGESQSVWQLRNLGTVELLDIACKPSRLPAGMSSLSRRKSLCSRRVRK